MADLVARIAFRFSKYQSITSTSNYYGSHIKTSLLSTNSIRKMYNSPIRYSTSGLINQLDHLRIDNINDARALVGHLHLSERELLKTALKEQWDKDVHLNEADITFTELKQLFVVNMMPFVGFGILDNMIMICAGEYIDQQLGALLCISTMAAAALGNIISDVAGVGLAHYVEDLVLKAGIKHPTLNSDQLESAKARYTVNASRAVGLVIGCFIGMFPLLFFDSKETETTKECEA